MANAGFEAGLTVWQNCGAAANIGIDNSNASEGASSLRIGDGGCIYQEQAATPGTDYTLSCDATRAGSNWTILELAFLDASFSKLASDFVQIGLSDSFTGNTVAAGAPVNTEYVICLLYTSPSPRDS